MTSFAGWYGNFFNVSSPDLPTNDDIAIYSAQWPSEQASQSKWGVPSLNHGRSTGYPDLGFCDFS
jgi:hypothetical protein